MVTVPRLVCGALVVAVVGAACVVVVLLIENPVEIAGVVLLPKLNPLASVDEVPPEENPVDAVVCAIGVAVVCPIPKLVESGCCLATLIGTLNPVDVVVAPKESPGWVVVATAGAAAAAAAGFAIPNAVLVGATEAAGAAGVDAVVPRENTGAGVVPPMPNANFDVPVAGVDAVDPPIENTGVAAGVADDFGTPNDRLPSAVVAVVLAKPAPLPKPVELKPPGAATPKFIPAFWVPGAPKLSPVCGVPATPGADKFIADVPGAAGDPKAGAAAPPRAELKIPGFPCDCIVLSGKPADIYFFYVALWVSEREVFLKKFYCGVLGGRYFNYFKTKVCAYLFNELLM